jgi:membrane fusion protein, multidrug efflux system
MLRILFVGLIAVAAVSGCIWYSGPAPQPRAASAPSAVIVSATPAMARDIPVLLSGIGTVQALNTVQIRSRLDGTLDKVNFEEGQQVKQGDVLAIIDPRLYQAALDQAKAKLAQDQAQLLSDEKDLERSRQLSQQRFASQQSVDQLTAKVGVDRALIEADQAFIRTAETNLSYTTIAAPFPGRIGLRAVDPGNIVKANDTSTFIATLTQQHPIGLVFTLPEAQLSAIRAAQRAGDVPVIAMDQEGKKPVAKGKLQVIDNQVDQTTGMIRLKAVFDNQDDALWPGQYTPVQVQVGFKKNAVTVPTAALQRGPNGLFVWIATPEMRAGMAPVETGPAYEGVTVAQKGLKEGDLVIVSNQYRLQPNARIELNAPPVAANDASGRS